MMNVKKYRAATTREALEQIKQELGEDAFVLETKQVKSGGFFGLRSEMQIEVSAAAPGAGSPAATAAVPAKTVKSSSSSYNSILNLADDSPALPNLSERELDSKQNLLNALNSRAVAARDFEAANVNFTEEAREFVEDENALEAIDAVEISPDAPRLIHQKREEIAPVLAERNIASLNIAENPSLAFTNREIEMLRAEMREIKFSLGAFANRQNAYFAQNANGTQNTEAQFGSPFFEAHLYLTATGISNEFAQKMVRDVMPHFQENFVEPQQIAKAALQNAVFANVKFESDPLKDNEQTILAFIGSTGVGKTTTIAKLAARVALHEQRRVELVTIDTYRIAAVEQLKTYAEIIGAGCHVVRSVFELDAMLRRLPSDATILIDTTGRNPHDLADQHELSDYLRRRVEIRKCLTVQATTNPADSLAAIKKFEMYGVDCLAFTKMDETTRPGALLELAAASNLPLTYFCAGQRVPEDLQTATPETFVGNILRENA